jgi:hypothetical protein
MTRPTLENARMVPAKGKRILCRKLPIMISNDAHKLPTIAALSQISFNRALNILGIDLKMISEFILFYASRCAIPGQGNIKLWYFVITFVIRSLNYAYKSTWKNLGPWAALYGLFNAFYIAFPDYRQRKSNGSGF